ncbi:hypothetical protein [Brevundimonas sp.]|uniref:hypothetical protein n=1 Tax=Brevundimonas sp. TaxID=1871086 RepID=UPI00356A8B33
MEDLHPGVQAIVRGLLSSPLSDVGRLALDRLRCGPDPDKRYKIGDDADEYRDLPTWRWEPTHDDARLQLVLIEDVIHHWLVDELHMAREISQLSRKLELKVIAFEGQGEAPVGRPDFSGNLVGTGRIKALQTFGKAFRKSIRTVREAIDQGGVIR